MFNTRWLIRAINSLYFLALLFFGFWFGKERAVFDDSSMQLYDMSLSHSLHVDLNMIVTVVNFLFPFLAILAGASVKVMVYSLVLNYLLLPLITFLFMRYRQGSLRFEFGFLFTMTLFSAQTYFFPIHDYWTGYYLLFILYRVAADPELGLEGGRKLKVEIALVILLMFTHLSVLISVGFLYLYLLFDGKVRLHRIIRVYAVMLLVLVMKVLLVNTGYQNAVISPGQSLPYRVWHILETPSVREFFRTFGWVNANFPLLSMLVLVLAFLQRKYLLAGLYILVAAVSVVMIGLLFPDFGYSIYTEGYFKSLNIVSGIMAANLIFDSLDRYRWLMMPLIVNFLFSVCMLWQGGNVIREQYAFVKDSVAGLNRNIYLHSAKPICPLECLVISRQSILVNQLEFGRNNCIFANIGGEPYVEQLNRKWILDNHKQPVRNFTFQGDPVYLDADSLGFPIERFSVLFFNRPCEEMVRRLSQ